MNAVYASASGGFRIVFDTLVLTGEENLNSSLQLMSVPVEHTTYMKDFRSVLCITRHVFRSPIAVIAGSIMLLQSAVLC